MFSVVVIIWCGMCERRRLTTNNLSLNRNNNLTNDRLCYFIEYDDDDDEEDGVECRDEGSSFYWMWFILNSFSFRQKIREKLRLNVMIKITFRVTHRKFMEFFSLFLSPQQTNRHEWMQIFKANDDALTHFLHWKNCWFVCWSHRKKKTSKKKSLFVFKFFLLLLRCNSFSLV
jgi:hypothetical protein